MNTQQQSLLSGCYAWSCFGYECCCQGFLLPAGMAYPAVTAAHDHSHSQLLLYVCQPSGVTAHHLMRHVCACIITVCMHCTGLAWQSQLLQRSTEPWFALAAVPASPRREHRTTPKHCRPTSPAAPPTGMASPASPWKTLHRPGPHLAPPRVLRCWSAHMAKATVYPSHITA